MAPSSQPFLLIALATTYFNTPPPAVISRRPHPHSDIPSSFYLFYSIPSPLLLPRQKKKTQNQLSKKAQLEHGPRPISALS